jgi:uncharacterized membrane protein
MTVKNIKIWYASAALFFVALIPFLTFVIRPTLITALISFVVSLAVSGVYIFTTKRITHPEDKYTAVQAMKFAKQCKKEGLRNSTNCKENKELFMQIAAANEAMKNLNYQKALEAFQLGNQLALEMKGK